MLPDLLKNWKKSSYSAGNGGQCVEVAHGAGIVGVRDSKNSGGPVLTFGQTELARFLAVVKAGCLDG